MLQIPKNNGMLTALYQFNGQDTSKFLTIDEFVLDNKCCQLISNLWHADIQRLGI